MSWLRVAGLDRRLAIRSHLIVGATTGYLLAALILAVGLAVVGDDMSATGALLHVISLYEWLIPALGLVVSYHAIVGERDARTMQHLLTAPFHRGEIILGKFVSRCIVVLVTILVSATGVCLSIWILFPGFGSMVAAYLVFTLITVVFGIAMVAIGIGISSMCDRSVRAVTAAMGTFIALVFLWDLLPAAVYFVRFGRFPGSTIPPDWYFFLIRVNPIEAYVEALTGVFGFLASELFHGVPFYLGPAAMWLILFAWILGSLVIGYHRFRDAEIA